MSDIYILCVSARRKRWFHPWEGGIESIEYGSDVKALYNKMVNIFFGVSRDLSNHHKRIKKYEVPQLDLTDETGVVSKSTVVSKRMKHNMILIHVNDDPDEAENTSPIPVINYQKELLENPGVIRVKKDVAAKVKPEQKKVNNSPAISKLAELSKEADRAQASAKNAGTDKTKPVSGKAVKK